MEAQTKKCTRCKDDKPLEDFPINNRRKDKRASHCKACKNKYHSEYYAVNFAEESKKRSKWKKDNPEKVKAGASKYKQNFPHMRWASSTLCSHKGRGYSVCISSNELSILAKKTLRCQLCGENLDWAADRGKPLKFNSPTLDRVTNEKHVTMGNIMIVCYRCNMAKGQNSVRSTLDWAMQLLKHNGEIT